jgi:hypothetical protein
MTGDSVRTWKSMTYERASIALWWFGWLCVCVGLGAGFFLVAYDWVLQ